MIEMGIGIGVNDDVVVRFSFTEDNNEEDDDDNDNNDDDSDDDVDRGTVVSVESDEAAVNDEAVFFVLEEDASFSFSSSSSSLSHTKERCIGLRLDTIIVTRSLIARARWNV